MAPPHYKKKKMSLEFYTLKGQIFQVTCIKSSLFIQMTTFYLNKKNAGSKWLCKLSKLKKTCSFITHHSLFILIELLFSNNFSNCYQVPSIVNLFKLYKYNIYVFFFSLKIIEIYYVRERFTLHSTYLYTSTHVT